MAKADFPIYSTSARKGDKGIRLVEGIVSDQFGWLLRPQEGQKDLGIDAHIELLGSNGEAFGKLLAAQVKYGKSYFRSTNEDGFVFYGEIKHLNYYINYSLPVIIILCDPDCEQCWWSEIDPLETARTGTGWQITIPLNQKFDLTAKEVLTELAGPIQNYHSELEQYWHVNELLTMPKAFIDIVITREDIETQDTSRVLSILERFRSSKKVAKENLEKVSVSVYGYEEDSRELFEIPEIRAWFSKICEEFPYWFYFLYKGLGSLKLVVFSIVPYTVLSRDTEQSMLRVDIDMTELGPLLYRNYLGLNEMCYFAGLGDKEIYKISKEVSEILTPGFDYPDFEATQS